MSTNRVEKKNVQIQIFFLQKKFENKHSPPLQISHFDYRASPRNSVIILSKKNAMFKSDWQKNFCLSDLNMWGVLAASCDNRPAEKQAEKTH